MTDQKKSYVLAVAVGMFLSFWVIGSQIWPSFLYMAGTALGVFGLLVVLLSCLIMGLKHWKESFLSWMGPVLLSAGFMLLIPADFWIGRSIADWRFKSNLERYASVVDEIRSGKVSAPETLSGIDVKPLPPGVESIQAASESDGSVVVVFVTDTGFPLHVEGYVFKGCGTNVDCIAQFNAFSNKVSLREETGSWYHFYR